MVQAAKESLSDSEMPRRSTHRVGTRRQNKCVPAGRPAQRERRRVGDLRRPVTLRERHEVASEDGVTSRQTGFVWDSSQRGEYYL